MRFRPSPLIGLSLAFLAACGGDATVRYRLTFDTQDPASVEELTQATVRVVERRLARMEAGLAEQNVIKDADGVTLELTVDDGAAAETLTSEMTAPFDLQIMIGTTDVANADVTVEGLGAFDETGVTGDDLVNVVAEANPETQGGRIEMYFTDEGRAELGGIFAANVGNDLGLFVRGRIVSALTIGAAELPSPLVIDGVPDAEMAQIFADDVNVGTHVTVTPL